MLPTDVIDNSDLERAARAKTDAANVDTLACALRHCGPHHVAGLEAVNPLGAHEVTYGKAAPVDVGAAVLASPRRLDRTGRQHREGASWGCQGGCGSISCASRLDLDRQAGILQGFPECPADGIDRGRVLQRRLELRLDAGEASGRLARTTSTGVSLLASLHSMQAGTRLLGRFEPPRALGMTWSRLRMRSGRPQ